MVRRVTIIWDNVSSEIGQRSAGKGGGESADAGVASAIIDFNAATRCTANCHFWNSSLSCTLKKRWGGEGILGVKCQADTNK